MRTALSIEFVFLLVLHCWVQSATAQVPCFTKAGCNDEDSVANQASIPDCCAMPNTISYIPVIGAESCIPCRTYGWAQNISSDQSRSEFQISPISAVEGETVSLTLFLFKNIPANSIRFALDFIRGGTAVEGTDYTISYDDGFNIPGLIVLQSVPIQVNVTLLNDGTRGEGVESIILTLRRNATLTPDEPNNLLTNEVVTIAVEDKDAVMGQGVLWQMGMFGVSEEEGTAVICAVYYDAVEGFTIETSTTEFFALNGSDYISRIGPSSYLVWEANSTVACMEIPIVDDNRVENDELFNVNAVRVVESPSGARPNLPSPVAVLIMDNDLIPVVFTNGSITTTDDLPSIVVCAEVDSSLVDETVNYRIPIAVTTVEGSAKPGVDYQSFNNMTVGHESRAVFTPPHHSTCFTISLLTRQDDGLDDRNFFVEVMLRNGVDPSADQIRLPSNLEIVIQPAAQIEVGGIMDSVLSNPLYSVAVDMEGSQSDSNLCYEVHGEPRRTLNLVSDTCFSINARYEAIQGATGYNKIDKLFIAASDAAGQCNNILIEAFDCDRATLVASSDSARILTGRYRRNGLQVEILTGRVEVTLPCQRYPGGGIKVVAKCNSIYQPPFTEELLPVDNLHVEFQRGKLPSGLSPMPHGLVGQFWHLGFEQERFTEDFVDGKPRDTAFKMTTPTDLGSQSFVGLMYHLTWDLRPLQCLYAGSRQAGTSHYVTSPAGSVIQGGYSDYKVGTGLEEQTFSGFSTDFKYNVFPRDRYGCVNLAQ